MTKEEILIQIANDHSYESWGELMYDTHEHSQIEYTCEAMEIYAQSKIKEAQQSQWVSVNERLPDFKGQCLCCYYDPELLDDEKTPRVNVFNTMYGVFSNHTNRPISVTYWMPLPSPPQE